MSADFQQLHDLGIFVTAASGNSNDQQSGPISQDGVAYPAADPNVFAVGAVNSSDVITDLDAARRRAGPARAGVNIVMPKLGGGFVTEDGTSFASPYVAGTAALIKQADPSAKAGRHRLDPHVQRPRQPRRRQAKPATRPACCSAGSTSTRRSRWQPSASAS